MYKTHFVCAVLVLGLWLSGTVANAQNQISNWEFDQQLNPLSDDWHIWQGGNFDGVSIVKGAQMSGEYAMKIDIGTGSLDPLQIFRSLLKLEQGATYTISFMAKADAPRLVTVQLQARANNGWRTYWRQADLQLTTEPQLFTFQYTHTEATVGGTGIFDDDVDLHWLLVGDGTDLYLDHIWMGIGNPPPPLDVKTAHNPSPADDKVYTATWANLAWAPGATAATHDVYLADNFDDVNDRTIAAFQGNQSLAFLLVGFAGAPLPDGLIRGTTYYWAVDEVEADGVTTYGGPVWSFFVPPLNAYGASPIDGSRFVDPNVTLSWEPGFGAILHYLYFGQNFDDVNNATPGTGSPVSGTTHTPGTLEREKTYYWRVDEFNPPTTVKGEIWSFTIGKEGGGIQGAYFKGMDFNTFVLNRTDPQINFNWGNPGGPDPSVGDDQFSARWIGQVEAAFSETYTFYTRTDDGVRLWVDGRQLVDAWIDQGPTEYSGQIDLVAGQSYGVVMEYYENGGGAVAELRWSSPSTPKQLIPQAALSLPVKAFSPLPGNGAVDVVQTPTLQWSAGVEAASHELYFGTDPNAVASAGKASAEYVGSRQLGAESYVPPMLAWNSTYYWRVDEINNANPDSPWVGSVWGFTTADFRMVEDFESYNEIESGQPGSNLIYETWADGYGTTTNGSNAGYIVPFAPTMETANVHGGLQSGPMGYSNAGTAISEITRTFAPAQNWTTGGATVLSLWFYGDPANAPGQLYAKINGVQVNYPGAAANLSRPLWQRWDIDLASVGTNLQSVTSLTVGVQGLGTTGTLLLDDIALFRSVAPAPAEVYLEAEAAMPLGASWRKNVDPTSSGGSNIGSNDGDGDDNDVAPGPAWTASYAFSVPVDGVYKVVLRAQENGSDSFWVRISGATSQTHEDPDQPGTGWVRFNELDAPNGWAWDEVHSNDHGNAVVNWTLPAGAHTLEIAKREDGVLLDAILITSDVN